MCWYVFMHSEWDMTFHFLESTGTYALLYADFVMKSEFHSEATWKPKCSHRLHRRKISV